jgi:HEAT repeat protein
MHPTSAPDPAALRRLTQFLGANGEKLGKRAREAVNAYGDDAVPLLVALLGDPALSDEAAFGGGYVPIHAARLLGEAGDEAALEPLLARLEGLEAEDILHGAIVDALAEFGTELIEPGLAAYARLKAADARAGLVDALMRTKVKHPRLLEILRERVAPDLEFGVMMLAEYGDPAAVPDVVAALRAYLSKPRSPRYGLGGVYDFLDAIKALGGSVPPDLEAAVAAQQARQAKERARAFEGTGIESIERMVGPGRRYGRE